MGITILSVLQILYPEKSDFYFVHSHVCIPENNNSNPSLSDYLEEVSLLTDIDKWNSEDDVAKARPEMIKFLDKLRHTLEELSPELGVTDPSSGTVVIEK